MPHGDVIEIASALVDSVQAGRAARTRVVESAWVARRDSRDLRRRTRDTLDVHLQHGWRLWSAGFVAQPPGFLPDSWSESLASGDVLSNAMEAYESRKTLASLYGERL
jgi:hypothetical protein